MSNMLNNDHYEVFVTNRTHTNKIFLVYVILSIVSLVFISFKAGELGFPNGKDFFFKSLILLVVVLPLVLRVIHSLFMVKREIITIKDFGLVSEKGFALNFNQIEITYREFNRFWFQNALMLQLKNKIKFSITPTKRYHRLSNIKFEAFVKKVEANYNK